MTLEQTVNNPNIWPVVGIKEARQLDLYDARDVMSKPTMLCLRVNLSVMDIDQAITELEKHNISVHDRLTDDIDDILLIDYKENHEELDDRGNIEGIAVSPRAAETILIGHNIMHSHIQGKTNFAVKTNEIPVVVQVDEIVAHEEKCYECHRRKEIITEKHKHVIALSEINSALNTETQDPWRDYTVFLNQLPRYKFPAIMRRNLFDIQTLPSIITSKLLAPEPGQTIIDACAGPGRKTMHIAEMMKPEGKQPSGKLYAFEINPRRKTLILERAHRFDINENDFLLVNRLDSSDVSAIAQVLRDNRADSILVDPPCSSLGVRPRIFEPCIVDKWKCIRPIQIQRNILNTVSKFLKKDGKLVYSTCTLNQVEDEMQIEWFLKEKRGEFELETPQIEGTNLRPYLCNTEGSCKDMALKFLPKTHDSIGYFIAVMRKVG